MRQHLLQIIELRLDPLIVEDHTLPG
jgi:hypothetical protein